MKLGFFAVGIGASTEPQVLRTMAMAAERLGFATLWAPEHVVLVEEYASQYPYSSGKFPGPPDIPISDPFVTLAYAAAKAGVKHVVKLSGIMPALDSPFRFARMHAEIERILESSGIAFTQLRAGEFMQAYFRQVPSIVGKGLLLLPMAAVLDALYHLAVAIDRTR